jgi:hypothetical protein
MRIRRSHTFGSNNGLCRLLYRFQFGDHVIRFRATYSLERYMEGITAIWLWWQNTNTVRVQKKVH